MISARAASVLTHDKIIDIKKTIKHLVDNTTESICTIIETSANNGESFLEINFLAMYERAGGTMKTGDLALDMFKGVMKNAGYRIDHYGSGNVKIIW